MIGTRRVLMLLGIAALGVGAPGSVPARAQDAPPSPAPASRDSRLAVLVPFGARGQDRPDKEREGSLAEGGLRWLARQQAPG